MLDERFQQLLLVHGPALGRLAASYTNNRSDRDDLFQDIALAIWQALPTFRGESSERTFIFEQQQTRLFEAIQRLPIGFRQVIILTLEDMSYTEIASILGISESNVGVRLNRARQMLRQLLEVRK